MKTIFIKKLLVFIDLSESELFEKYLDVILRLTHFFLIIHFARLCFITFFLSFHLYVTNVYAFSMDKKSKKHCAVL